MLGCGKEGFLSIQNSNYGELHSLLHFLLEVDDSNGECLCVLLVSIEWRVVSCDRTMH